MFECPLRELPPEHAVVHIDGHTYYRSRDIYYKYCQGAYHRISNPYHHHPIEIPRYLSYRRVVIHGHTYYTKDGQYYIKQGKHYYKVANPYHYYASYR